VPVEAISPADTEIASLAEVRSLAMTSIDFVKALLHLAAIGYFGTFCYIIFLHIDLSWE
jgi:hypothetical protein